MIGIDLQALKHFRPVSLERVGTPARARRRVPVSARADHYAPRAGIFTPEADTPDKGVELTAVKAPGVDREYPILYRRGLERTLAAFVSKAIDRHSPRRLAVFAPKGVPRLMSATPSYEFRNVKAGVETLSDATRPRHHHDGGYATVVLSGSLTEVSFAGRMDAQAGNVLLHGRFDCHLNRSNPKRPVQILRLPWWGDTIEGLFYLKDPDALARLGEIDPARASAVLYEELRPVTPRGRYSVDALASALRCGSDLHLQEWAESRGLRPEFGVCPKRFRLECRTRLAWQEIVRSTESLTSIAVKLGFSDLAHLSRSIHSLTGRCPRDWRSTPSVNRLTLRQ